MYQPKKTTLLSSKVTTNKLSYIAKLISSVEAFFGKIYTIFQIHTHIETLHTHAQLAFTYFNEETALNNNRLRYSVAQKNNSISNTISASGKCRNLK